MSEEYNLSKYPEDTEEKFILETVRDIKQGEEGFVYKKELLDKIEEILQKKKIEYIVKNVENYWIMKGKKTKWMKQLQ